MLPCVATMSSKKVSVMWFRKGLRLHDNPALLEACKGAAHMYPVFVIDPHFLKQSSYKVGINRYNFLLESLSDLHTSLQKRGSRLLVLRGKPEEVLPRVFREWGVTQLCFEVDTEPYARVRDAQLGQLASAAGVQVSSFVSHTLYDTEFLVQKNGGKPPVSMQSFTKLVDRVGDPPAPAADPPSQLPPPAPDAAGTAPEETGVPTLQEVGFTQAPTSPFKGGETEALRRLEARLADPIWVAGFEKPQTDPSAYLEPSTTVLSPHLKFGTLSPRLFHHRLLAIYRSSKTHSQPPVSLRGQLLWREFFYTVGQATPNFHRMEGNPLCKQLPWREREEHLAAWREGRTGFPWIDAVMAQLRLWGWVHHLARHSVACFLTRGDLYISWEAGVAVFEELLLDQDHFLNAANWMWLSASAFFSQYFRVYSPVTFGKKYDPQGAYIRHFLPVLKDMPAKYIYEPWTAPLHVQKAAGCIIGQDYPAPIVDHGAASKECIALMKAGYEANRGPAPGAARAAAAGAGDMAELEEPPADAGTSAAADAAAARPAPSKGAAAAAASSRSGQSTGGQRGRRLAPAAGGKQATKRQKTLTELGVTVHKKRGHRNT